MANPSYIESLAGSLEAPLRRTLKLMFDYVLSSLRIGRAEDQTRSENFQMFAYKVTTPATANQEFSIPHGLGKTPYLLIPVLALDVAGSKIVELQVSKAADSERVYLKSPVTNAAIRVFIEG